MQEGDYIIQFLAAHSDCPFGFQEGVPKMWKTHGKHQFVVGAHQGEHEGLRKMCPFCSKKHYNEHVREIHQGIKKKCPHCSKLLRRVALWNHIKVAHNGSS